MEVTFPGLGLEFNINREAFSIGSLSVYWYGIIIASGLVLACIYAFVRADYFKIDKNKLLNTVIVGIICAIIGARLYYVIFNWSWYSKHMSEILNFRGGGMAIHGALIGGILAGFIYTKIKKINFFKMADTVMIGIPLGQAIGRWGNYINGEAHGGPTSLPWGIMVDGVKVHPTFLYESIWDLGIFIFLWFFRKHKKYEGQLAIYYLILYSLGRFFIEGLRTDSLMIGPLRMAQVISITTIIVCLILHKILSKKNKKRG